MTIVDLDEPAGPQLMEAIRDGEMPPPPAATLLGLQVDTVSEGAITFGFTDPVLRAR